MWLLLKNLLYNGLALGFLLGWMPWAFLVRHSRLPATWIWQHYAALPFVVVGTALYGACLWQFIRKGKGTPMPFDPAEKVLTRGPYAWVRNPMYIAILLLVLGEAVFLERIVVWLYFVFLACIFQIIVVAIEESALRSRFGALYSDYCNAVPARWFPRRPRPRMETIAPFVRDR